MVTAQRLREIAKTYRQDTDQLALIGEPIDGDYWRSVYLEIARRLHEIADQEAE